MRQSYILCASDQKELFRVYLVSPTLIVPTLPPVGNMTQDMSNNQFRARARTCPKLLFLLTVSAPFLGFPFLT